MMSMLKHVRAAAIVTLLVGTGLMASPAQAALVTVDSVGDSFNLVFNGNVATQDVADLGAQATFLVTAFSANSITFDITLTNTTGSQDGVLGSRVSGFGFDSSPNLTGASASGLFNIAVLGGSYPNQFGSLEACFKDGGGPNNCQGGGSGGVTNPNSGTFTIVLTFAGPITQFSFDRFGVRYQSITGTTLGESGTGEGALQTPPPSVPEPTTLVLLGTGLIGLASRKLRRS